MRPIIVYIEGSDEQITLTKDQLQKIVNEVYEQGNRDGGGYYYTRNPITITPTFDKTINIKPTEITCTGTGGKND